MDLKKRILENDNRCTAQPYLLLLQEKEWHVVEEGYGYNTKEVFVERISGDCRQKDSLAELIDYWNDGLEDDEKINEWVEDEHYTRHFMEYSWNTVNVFLTDQGYQEHLKLNKHNLREHRTFGIHAFRNPEFEEVFKMIGVLDKRN